MSEISRRAWAAISHLVASHVCGGLKFAERRDEVSLL
jgi:hypothetical protein